MLKALSVLSFGIVMINNCASLLVDSAPLIQLAAVLLVVAYNVNNVFDLMSLLAQVHKTATVALRCCSS